MEGIVTFYDDQIDWYHAYEDDAIVISEILGYEIFVRYNGKQAIGFPRKYLRKVTSALSDYNIGYTIFGSDVIIDYPNSRYKVILEQELNKKQSASYVKTNFIIKEKLNGKFTIQYNDEEPLLFVIGENINPEAEIIKFVLKNNVGIYNYGDDIVKIINKELEINKIRSVY